MTDVKWVGWVDEVPLPGRAAAKAPRRRAAKPGATTSVLDSLAAAAGGSGAAPDGGLSALDEIVAAWAAPDPVARAESGGAAALEGNEDGAAAPAMSTEEK